MESLTLNGGTMPITCNAALLKYPYLIDTSILSVSRMGLYRVQGNGVTLWKWLILCLSHGLSWKLSLFIFALGQRMSINTWAWCRLVRFLHEWMALQYDSWFKVRNSAPVIIEVMDDHATFLTSCKQETVFFWANFLLFHGFIFLNTWFFAF